MFWLLIMEKVSFIFAGRLVKEKWFDLILQLSEDIQQDVKLREKCHIHIFGAGILASAIPAYDFITYHGHVGKDTMKQVWKTCQYTLIPSRFLETFGLTALDSLSLWVPILAPDVGGLSQFLQADIWAISLDEPLYASIACLVNTFAISVREDYSLQAKKIASQYTKELRLAKFHELSGLESGAKILLVSDYIVNVWWIESYLLDAKEVLEQAWYVVRLIGCADTYKARNRFWQLFMTIWNTQGQNMLKQEIHTFQPDLIWRHSVQRRRWPLPLRSAKPSRATQWIMYHDFGLFHPYPSAVYAQESVVRSSSLVWYLGEWISISWRQFPLQLAKWCSTSLITAYLERIIDIHLVPSSYMEDLVQQHYKKKISLCTLSHFM